MTGFSLNDAAQHDHAVHIGILGEILSSERQFECSGNFLDDDILLLATRRAQRTDGPFEQSAGNLRIPLGNDDSELHVGRRRQLRVEPGEISVYCCHIAFHKKGCRLAAATFGLSK